MAATAVVVCRAARRVHPAAAPAHRSRSGRCSGSRSGSAADGAHGPVGHERPEQRAALGVVLASHEHTAAYVPGLKAHAVADALVVAGARRLALALAAHRGHVAGHEHALAVALTADLDARAVLTGVQRRALLAQLARRHAHALHAL